MKFGCCLNMVATDPERVGTAFLESAARIGFDYVELPLAQMMQLSERAFFALSEQLRAHALPCEACNNFFPVSLRLTGGRVDHDAVFRYYTGALARAGALGVSRVVFGSGPAKTLPEGFPQEEGWRQLVSLLKKIGPDAERLGITIAIEPLHREECNIINTYKEGCALAREVAHPAVRVLVDGYHLAREEEPVGNIIAEKDLLCHVHFAETSMRRFPKSVDEPDQKAFMDALKKAGYDQRISLEAYSDHFESDAAAALNLIKSYFM